MPEVLLHFSIPFSAVFSITGRLRYAFLAGVFGIIPDLDILFGIHRSPTHSIPVLLAVAVPVLVMLSSRNSRFLKASKIGLFGILTHPILDLFDGYTPILWPLSGYSPWIKFSVEAYLSSTPSLNVDCQVLWQPTIFHPVETIGGVLVTPLGAVISAALMLPPLVMVAIRYYKFLRSLDYSSI